MTPRSIPTTGRATRCESTPTGPSPCARPSTAATWCKGHIWHNKCERWGPPNGWTRVSRGSHAGHIPDATPSTGLHERSTTAPDLQLVPLETLDHKSYRH